MRMKIAVRLCSTSLYSSQFPDFEFLELVSIAINRVRENARTAWRYCRMFLGENVQV